jgi:hypothetical protein
VICRMSGCSSAKKLTIQRRKTQPDAQRSALPPAARKARESRGSDAPRDRPRGGSGCR